MGNKLYVGNIPYDTNEDDLTALFAKAGKVATVNVMRDRETGRARGFAFVEMATDKDAQNAIAQLHEQSFGGRTLTVNEARPMQPRGGGGGGFGGGGGGRGGRGGGGGGRRQEPRWEIQKQIPKPKFQIPRRSKASWDFFWLSAPSFSSSLSSRYV